MTQNKPSLAPTLMGFEGGNALSAFRAQALLPSLKAVSDRITGLAARHVHWVMLEPGSPADTDKLAALLRYGDPAPAGINDPGQRVLVMPRLGTVSPWASKATDIARNCGFGAAVGGTGGPALHRVERVTEYAIPLKTGLLGGAGKPLTAAEQAGLELDGVLRDTLHPVQHQAAVAGDVGGLAGPGRDSAQARHHQHPLAWCVAGG